MRIQYVTANQAAVLSDLALTMLQTPRDSKSAVLTRILTGKLNELEPEPFRKAMANFVRCASGAYLDVVGELVDLTRGTIEHSKGYTPETDTSYKERILAEIRSPKLRDGTEELLGFSLKTTLHFDPAATFTQQQTAIGKIIELLQKDIEHMEVGQTLRLNELWFLVRLACQDIVVDVGEPNRPFQQILLWRRGIPEPLVDNYVLQPGEQLTLEKSIAIPIDLQPAAQQ
jgi:hypothetical protein